MPKLLALPMGVKGVAVAASAFTHVALAWASLSAGHGGTVVSLVSLAPTADEVEIEAPVEPEPAPPTTEPDDDDHHPHTPAHLAAVPHAHKHDYPVAPSHDTTPHDPHLVHFPFAPPSAPTGDPPSGEAAPAVVAAPTGAGRFTITVGTGGSGVAPGGGAATSSVAPSGPPASTEIVPESTVSIPARVVASVRPAYPSAARAADIEADVALEMVVDPTGVVLSARVVRPAGYGFDDAALQAIRRFRFSPAQRNGHAIGVRMRWVMQFRFQ